MIGSHDEAMVRRQLGRPPRAIHDVGHRCPCGNPDVVVTEPRLPNGTPFPTTFYLTCPRAASLIGTLEGSGLMKQMQARLGTDPELALAYRAAHEAYLAARAELGDVPEIDGITAGGMPDRVKCLHVLAGHALATGPGVNPLGDEVLELLGEWWANGPCVRDTDAPVLDASVVEPVETSPAPHRVSTRSVPASSLSRGRCSTTHDRAFASSAPIAAIDCGTNTIKLLIAHVDDHIHDVVRTSRMVRLGQDVDRTGRLADDALARTFAAIEEYADLIVEHGVDSGVDSGAGRIRFCATSATRDAANAQEFSDGVLARIGVRPEVLAGAEEAALSFGGAVRALATVPAPPVLVVDIGGGSTELVLGAEGPDVAHSMNIGSVRLHERHVHHDPPTDEEVAAIVADVDAALDASPVDVAAARFVVGVAGTVTTIAAGVLGLPAYDRAAIDQQVLSVTDVRAQVDRLVAMPVAQRRDLPWMHPGRADVIDAGALIWARVLDRASVTSVLVSESDILDGIAWSLG